MGKMAILLEQMSRQNAHVASAQRAVRERQLSTILMNPNMNRTLKPQPFGHEGSDNVANKLMMKSAFLLETVPKSEQIWRSLPTRVALTQKRGKINPKAKRKS